jgi:epoxyqueuosine reductase
MNELDQIELTAMLKSIAKDHGFHSLKISRATTVDSDADVAVDRIIKGNFSGLTWFTEERMQVASNPTVLLPSARSVMTFAINYFDSDAEPRRNLQRGQIARYALGQDYHRSLKRRLSQYMDAVKAIIEFSPEYRIFVDDSPLLERAFARESGLGWVGKNTNLLVPGNGSWVFLAEIIISLELVPDEPSKKSCGSCRRCVDICPTGAISSEYEVNNDICISFLTIENRGPIPTELRKPMGTWIFGCDLCQEICPVNARADEVAFDEFRIREEMHEFDMREILKMSEEAFRDKFQGTPIMRAKYTGMQRNVCVALGNIANPEDVDLLIETLGNISPLVRGHAVWALAQIGSEAALKALNAHSIDEQDAWVIVELVDALGN